VEVDKSQVSLSPAAAQRLVSDLKDVTAQLPQGSTADQEVIQHWVGKVQEMQAMYTDMLGYPAGI
jgi:hypothetical protein